MPQRINKYILKVIKNLGAKGQYENVIMIQATGSIKVKRKTGAEKIHQEFMATHFLPQILWKTYIAVPTNTKQSKYKESHVQTIRVMAPIGPTLCHTLVQSTTLGCSLVGERQTDPSCRAVWVKSLFMGYRGKGKEEKGEER